MGERESAHEHGPGRGGPLAVAGGIVGEAAPADVAGAHGDLPEAARAARLERDRLADPGEDEAVAIRLLEAEEAILRPPRAQDRGRQVELGRDRLGHRGERGRAVAPGTGDGGLDPLAEERVSLARQREADCRRAPSSERSRHRA